jgi:hypothetical protein
MQPASNYGGAGYRYGGTARTRRADKTSAVFNKLAMTNEEKILRKNYGANYESQVQLLDRGNSLMQNRKIGYRKVSTANMK